MPNFRPVFTFDTGQSIIYGYWQPGNDPETVSAELMRLANASGDWTVPMAAAKQAVIEDTKRHFLYEEDPEGDHWEPLNEQYLAQKQEDGFPPDILHRTGEMEDVATSEEAWHVTEREIIFNTEMLPFYGPYHQEGEYSYKRTLRRAMERGITLSPHAGKPTGALPQREFIGISDEAADEIQDIFGEWLDGQVKKYIPPKPRGGGRISLPPRIGDFVSTSKLGIGELTNVPAFGGGFLVRGRGGKFVPGVFKGEFRQ